MADQAIPAVITTTDLSLPACTISIDSLMSLPERTVPMLSEACQAVRANEEARLAALNLGQVSSGITDSTPDLATLVKELTNPDPVAANEEVRGVSINYRQGILSSLPLVCFIWRASIEINNR